jgi:HK97 family phage prohead protease
MTHAHTFAPFEVKAADFESRTFEGLASTWDLDSGNDIIHKGAYKRTLSHWKSAAGRQVIPLVDQHNYGSIRSVLGKMVDGEETDVGLHTKWQVVPGNDGDELLHRLKGGFVTGLSIGYEAVGKPEYTEEDRDGRKVRVRHLKELKLYEVSAVVFPMTEGARLDPTSVKCLTDALRNGTLTDEQADLLASVFDGRKAKASYGTGDRVEALADHMDGMKGSIGVIAEVRSGPYYGVRFEGERRVHRWLAQDELRAADADARSTGGMSNMKHTSALMTDEPAPEPATPEAPALYEKASELALRIRLLRLKSPGTRAA